MNINLANIDFCPGGKSATLTETTAEILLSETEKVIVPPEGTDGFNKVTITHAPVEESVSATITSNGTHTITPSEGFGAMVGVSVDVNVSSSGDTMKYFNEKPTADDTGLKAIGWDDESVNYFKYNTYAYPWEADKYKVSDANKQITINSKSDIATYASNPDFKYCPKFDTSAETDMNNMFNNCLSLAYIPQLDTSKVTNMSLMFEKCSSLTTIPLLDTGNVTNMSNMFSGCSSLTTIPQLNTSNVTDMNNMFNSCSSLTTIPQLDTGNVTNMVGMFEGSSSLTTIPQLNTSKVTDMSSIFYTCKSLTTIPLLDTGNVTNMKSMFGGCSSLTSIPQLDTSKVTNMVGMFTDCRSLTTIPQLDTSNVTQMGETEGYNPNPWYPVKKTYGMFQNCTSLTTIPMLNTSNVTNMEKMFYGCTSLTTIPQLDTSKLEGSRWMFEACTHLVSVPRLDMSNNVACYGMFGQQQELSDLKNIGGLIGLKDNLQLNKCPNLTKESILNVFNDAADVTADPKTITLGDNLRKLTADEKAIATNKGWTLK